MKFIVYCGLVMHPIQIEGYNFKFSIEGVEPVDNALLERIARLALKQLDTQSLEEKDGEINITISLIPQDQKHVQYRIGNLAATVIACKEEALLPISSEDVRSILEQFPDREPSTYTEKFTVILAGFFHQIYEVFEDIQWLFTGISGSEKRLQWDLCVLSEICNTPFDRKMTLPESLQYMVAILKKEKNPDQALQKRLENAIFLANQFHTARKSSFYRSQVNYLEKKLKKEVKALKEEGKFLIPIELWVSGKKVESLLEVSKQSSGRYKVSFISADKETRELFTQEEGLQVIRREMENISEEDLLLSLRSLVEMQISPKRHSLDAKQFLLKTLHFNDSIVTMSDRGYLHKKQEDALGHFLETLTYVSDDRKDKEAKRLELGVMLRAFFDLEKTSKRSCKNRAFWEKMHATCVLLAGSISESKEVLGDQECDKIQEKLQKIIKDLEKAPPKMKDIVRQPAPYFRGFLFLPKRVPFLSNLQQSKVDVIRYQEKEDAPLVPDFTKPPLEIVRCWKNRLDWLSSLKMPERIYTESKAMIRMMNRIDFKKLSSKADCDEFIELCDKAAKILAQSFPYKERSLEDALCMMAVSLCAQTVAAQASYLVDSTYSLDSEFLELQDTSLEEQDLHWIRDLYTKLTVAQANSSKELGKESITCRQLSTLMKNSINNVNKPLSLRVASYPSQTLADVHKTALIYKCPYGCCRNDHIGLAAGNLNFPTEYMMQCYSVFQPVRVMKEAEMPADEAVEFNYTQITLQDPAVFLGKGEAIPFLEKAFTEEDERAQAINAVIVYQKNPDYFKCASLRFAFTRKLFSQGVLAGLCKDKVFVRSMVRDLIKIAKIAKKSGDLHVAAYLLDVLRKTSQVIEDSPFQGSLQLITKIAELKIEESLDLYARELLSSALEGIQEQQMVVFPIALDVYFRKMQEGKSLSKLELKNVMAMVCSLEKIRKGKEKIDAELRDRYLTLFTWISPDLRKLSSDVMNEMLFSVYLEVGIEKLSWNVDDFPTLRAFDKLGRVRLFNILTGGMSVGELRAEALSEATKTDPHVQRLFTREDLEQPDWKVFTSAKNKNAIVYTHDRHPDKRITILLQKNEKRYEPDTVTVKVQRKHKSGWLDYVRFDAQDSLENGIVKENSDLSPQLAALIQDRECWRNYYGSKVYVMEKDKAYATLTMRGETITDVYLIEDKRHLLKPKDRVLERFSLIENSDCIQVIGLKNDPESLVYFRYRFSHNNILLSYSKQKDGTFEIPELSGFKLQPFGTFPGKEKEDALGRPLPRALHSFHFLKKSTQEKVMIPFRAFESEETRGGQTALQTKMLFSEEASCPIFEYDLDPETNRLKAKASDGYAYLAYLCFVHGDYGLCSEYMKKASTALGYKENYLRMFRWIHDVPVKGTASEVAMRLKFMLFEDGALKTKEAFDSQPLDSQVLEKRLQGIVNLYAQYELQEKQRDPAFSLSTEEKIHMQDVVHRLQKNLAETGSIIEGVASTFQEYEAVLKEKDLLGVSEEVRTLWAHQQKGAPSSMVIQEPSWVLRNFVTTLQLIIRLDSKSEDYKALKKRILAVSSLSKDPQILLAEKRLLQMCKAKEEKGEVFDSIQAEIRKFSYSSKKEGAKKDAVKIAARLFEKGFLNEFSLSNYEELIDKAWNITFILGNERSSWIDLATRPYEVMEKYRIRQEVKNIAYKFRKFAVDRKDSGFTEEESKTFLLTAIYGKTAKGSFGCLEKICNELDVVTDIRPVQKQNQAKALQEMKEALSFDTKKSEIDALKEAIANSPNPEPVFLIQSDPEKIFTLLEESYLSYFTFDAMPKPALIPDVLSNIDARFKNPASRRLANEHLIDAQSFLEEQKPCALEQKKAGFLKTALEQDLEESNQSTKKLEKEILTLVDEKGDRLEQLAGYKPKATVHSAILRWRRGEIDGALKDKIEQYLLEVTKRNHLVVTLDLVKSYIADQSLDEGRSQEILIALQTKRYYSKEDPDFTDLLFVEHVQKIILRNTQVDTVREMLANPHAVRQLRMGQGKSKVLLPILAQKKANGKNLVMLLLPEELYETNCQDLDQTNRELFGQKMYRFDFNRTIDLNEKTLREIQSKLLGAIPVKGYVKSTKRSLLSFRDAYIEQYALLKKDPHNANLIANIRIMSEILSIFMEQTDVLADEVDSRLNIREEVNFALGSGESVDPVKIGAGVMLFNLMFTNSSCEGLVKALQENTQAALSEEEKKVFLLELAKAYATKNPYKFESFSVDQIASYLVNEPDANSDVLLWVQKLKKEGNLALYKEITAVKAFINQGFMTTLSRIGNVNYGRDPDSSTWTIPYQASNMPRVGSEFDDDVEKITFMLQDYMQNGVRLQQISQLIIRMDRSAKEELASFDSEDPTSYEQTKAGKAFIEFLNEMDKGGSNFNGISLSHFTRSEKLQKQLLEVVNKNLSSRISFCEMALKEMQQFCLQIQSDALDSVDIIDKYAGFTGTLWNRHTFHDKISAEKTMGEDGFTWNLLYRKNIEVKEFVFDPTKPIDSLLDQLDITGNYQAVIDLGAYLRGTTNADFIDAALLRSKGVEAGVYFDDAGRIVKKRKEKDPLPIELAPETDLTHTLTLYDQIHTTGTDIRQAKAAKAVVTIGENTFIRDVFQAVWRMRQLHRNQTVVFAVSDQIKARIPHKEGEALTIDDILAFCLMNESQRESNDNFRAEKAKIQGACKRELLHMMVKAIVANLSDEKIQELAEIVGSEEASIFIQKKQQEACYDQYSQIEDLLNPEDVLQGQKDKAKKECERLGVLLAPVKQDWKQEFSELSGVISNRKSKPCELYPEKVPGSSSAAEATVEAQKMQEQETQKEQQTQIELEVVIAAPSMPKGSGGVGEVLLVDASSVITFMNEASAQTIPRAPSLCKSYSQTLIKPITAGSSYFDNVHYTRAYEINHLTNSTDFFHVMQKPIMMVSIAKSKDGWSMLIPSIHEAHMEVKTAVQAFSKEDQKAALVALSCNSDPMLIASSQNDFPFSGEDEDQFYSLYIQAKLLNGDTVYSTEKEKTALRKWLLEKDARAFREYFEKNILSVQNPRVWQSYPKTFLYKIFEELAPSIKT